MAEKPILFSGAMIRALLDGKKTQTRRVVVPTNSQFGAWGKAFWEVADMDHAWKDGVGSGSEYLHVPVKPGTLEMDGVVDRLRPRFAPERCWDQQADRHYTPPASRLWVRETWADDTLGGTLYAADPFFDGAEISWNWKPSIHMHRRRSRLTLEVTGVRVERVQDISDADARAEGIDVAGFRSKTEGIAGREHIVEFSDLWDSLNAERGYGWESNPWVWAISFRLADNPSLRVSR